MNRVQFSVIALSGLFLLTAWSSIWFEISAVGTYSEGLEREPKITTEYLIDSDQESIEISIENSTSLLLYWMNREDVSSNQNNSDQTSNTSIKDVSGKSDNNGEFCSSSCLDTTRIILKLTMITMLAAICLYNYNPNSKIRIGTFIVWGFGLTIILIAIPLAAAIDFGIAESGDDSDESSTGGFDTNTQDTVQANQFAHFEQDNGFGFSKNGLKFTYESVGFDLGLINEGDRQEVIDNPPSEGEPAYDSLIRFNGELTIGPGSLVLWWTFILPLLILNSNDSTKFPEEE